MNSKMAVVLSTISTIVLGMTGAALAYIDFNNLAGDQILVWGLSATVGSLGTIATLLIPIYYMGNEKFHSIVINSLLKIVVVDVLVFWSALLFFSSRGFGKLSVSAPVTFTIISMVSIVFAAWLYASTWPGLLKVKAESTRVRKTFG